MSDAIAIHQAFETGDLEALKSALGSPRDFPNAPGPRAIGDSLLEYAIYHSPTRFIKKLLELGADANYQSPSGFPSIIAALSTRGHGDMLKVIELLLGHGADIQQRGINHYTPLHYAASRDDAKAVALLLAHGADMSAKTNIDEFATPLQEAEILGCTQAARILRETASGNG